VDTVKRAIEMSSVDFGVIYGVRSLEEQKKLYAAGRSQTMKSRHLIQQDGTSHAVDLMAYDGSDPSWDIVMYDDIADAMKEAAIETGVKICWGAAWHIDDIAKWDGTMEQAMNAYVDLRRSSGRRPFIDGPHFQLST
jgi:peptidoglycan L-alanyl-D-glutamate endopeptidase CwlK